MGKYTVDVRLFTINDDIALEYDDTVILEFKPLYPQFMEELGRKGEFIRESTVVKIIDNDSKLNVEGRELECHLFYFRCQNLPWLKGDPLPGIFCVILGYIFQNCRSIL